MENKILELLEKNNGIITTKQVESAGMSRIYLKKLIDEGKIKKIRRGVYTNEKFSYDEFYIFQLIYPKTVFSHNTALYFQNMTERTPIKMDVTIYTGYNPYRFKDEVNIYRCKKELLDLGLIEIKSPQGRIVKAYNLERTVCDLIKNKKYMDIEIMNKSIKNCIKNKDFDANKMFKYAEKLKIYHKIKEYMEMII